MRFKRETVSKLLDTNLNSFAAELQRGEIPWERPTRWNGVLAEIGGWITQGQRAEPKRGYPAEQIFLTLVRDEFIDQFHMRKMAAARIASCFPLSDESLWRKIADGSSALREGRNPIVDVLFGAMSTVDGRTFVAVAEHAEIDKLFALLPARLRAQVFVNVTRIAATLRARASHHQVDLDEFWKD
jgi:hypothetical protein